MKIRIIKTPDGPAPLEVRRAWVGATMEAELLPQDTLEVNSLATEKLGLRESDFSSAEQATIVLDAVAPGTTKGNRGGCWVLIEEGLKALGGKSTEAADWFRKNWPTNQKPKSRKSCSANPRRPPQKITAPRRPSPSPPKSSKPPSSTRPKNTIRTITKSVPSNTNAIATAPAATSSCNPSGDQAASCPAKKATRNHTASQARPNSSRN